MWEYNWREGSGQTTWKVVVPPSGVKEILKEHHDRRIAGHFGINRTLNRVRSSPYFWPGMKASVEEFCQSCEICFWTKLANRIRQAQLQKLRAHGGKERVVHVDGLKKCPVNREEVEEADATQEAGETPPQRSVFEEMGLHHLITRSGRNSRPPDRL